VPAETVVSRLPVTVPSPIFNCFAITGEDAQSDNNDANAGKIIFIKQRDKVDCYIRCLNLFIPIPCETCDGGFQICVNALL
jgi:hypothetical protein